MRVALAWNRGRGRWLVILDDQGEPAPVRAYRRRPPEHLIAQALASGGCHGCYSPLGLEDALIGAGAEMAEVPALAASIE